MHKTRLGLTVGIVGAVIASVALAAPAAAAEVDSSSGHTYDLVTGVAPTWEEARLAASATVNGGDLCQGYLASITGAEENAFLVTAFGGEQLQFKWFGGAQPDPLDVADGWTWSNGESWGYTNWLPGEPNNVDYGPYGVESVTAFIGVDGEWNDAPAGWNYGEFGGYVVEYDCRQIVIDVKPGSTQNSVNDNGHGVIPVAILTTEDFDAASVDPFSVTLDGAAVKVKGKSGNAGALEDVDGDGDLDLMVQITDSDATYTSGTTQATLNARTYDGSALVGTDVMRLVPQE